MPESKTDCGKGGPGSISIWLVEWGLRRLVGASLPHRTSQNSPGDNHIFLSSELEESLL